VLCWCEAILTCGPGGVAQASKGCVFPAGVLGKFHCSSLVTIYELEQSALHSRPTKAVMSFFQSVHTCTTCLSVLAIFLIFVCTYTSLLRGLTPSLQVIKMTPDASPEPKSIVIIGKMSNRNENMIQVLTSFTGGGIIGTSTAYYLSRHPLYRAKSHKITVLEATKIASGSSGKGGGFIAEWATPKCLGPLSFRLHGELAKEHNGDKVWGHRSVFASEIKLFGKDVKASLDREDKGTGEAPSDLDWLRPGSIQEYNEIGNRSNSGQVNPFMLTTTLAKLAEEKGVNFSLHSSATKINLGENDEDVKSVSFTKDGITQTIEATDVVVSAGPWTPRVYPAVSLLTPRGHSVIVKPTRPLSPYILFPNIQPEPNSSIDSLLSPDIYPRPADQLHAFDTVYSSGPDDYEAELPTDNDQVKLVDQKLEDIMTAIGSVSQEMFGGEIVTKQACYKPQIRPHEEEEEVGPMVGPTGVKGLWLATGHDEWGIQNGPGTGLLMSEMILEGNAHSADTSSLDPKHFLKASGAA
jgi:glycine/D-amino acid oxidase-like deaminating enzyme